MLIEFQCFHGSHKNVIIPQRTMGQMHIPFFQHSNIFNIFDVKKHIVNVATSFLNSAQRMLIHPPHPPPSVYQKIRYVFCIARLKVPQCSGEPQASPLSIYRSIYLSYPILSYRILSCPTYLILSYPILPILSYPILSYPILSYPSIYLSTYVYVYITYIYIEIDIDIDIITGLYYGFNEIPKWNPLVIQVAADDPEDQGAPGA